MKTFPCFIMLQAVCPLHTGHTARPTYPHIDHLPSYRPYHTLPRPLPCDSGPYPLPFLPPQSRRFDVSAVSYYPFPPLPTPLDTIVPPSLLSYLLFLTSSLPSSPFLSRSLLVFLLLSLPSLSFNSPSPFHLVSSSLLPSACQFFTGDFLDLSTKDWTDADVVFMNSTCYDDALVKKIAAIAGQFDCTVR